MFCGENKYADTSGPAQKMVNNVQKNLIEYQTQIQDKKESTSRIFQRMRLGKDKFMETLLKGEKEGHC